MLKRLKEKQLEALIQSIESGGGELMDCVLLPKGEQRLGRKTIMPHVLCCKLWRWPEMTNSTELKRLPCCTSGSDPLYQCCNPYHWSLVTKPDVQISTFDWAELEKVRDLELSSPSTDSPVEPVSMETGMTPTIRRDYPYDHDEPVEGDASHSLSNQIPHWCSLAYWEKRDRVGRLLKVYDPFINIFQHLPHGSGLCLRVLQENFEQKPELQENSHRKSDPHENLDPYVKRTREKIGLGIVLSREIDGVWIYNRSEYPVFVNSPTLDVPNTHTLFVIKCPPGHSLKIFDYHTAHLMEEIRDPKYLDGPYDPNSVRISFAKGWGPHYSRQIMTSCPCWIEVLLNWTGAR